MSELKSIPTTYNGVTYRSRLEARWAVFFDQIEIEHYYEYEGFQLPSGWYLPDFYLPAHGWFEIKPTRITDNEYSRIEELNSGLRKLHRGNEDITRNSVYILIGFPLKEFSALDKEQRYIQQEIWLENFENKKII